MYVQIAITDIYMTTQNCIQNTANVQNEKYLLNLKQDLWEHLCSCRPLARSFPVNYGIEVIFLCGDNSIYGKIREFVFLFLFINFLCLFDCSSIKSYMFFTWYLLVPLQKVKVCQIFLKKFVNIFPNWSNHYQNASLKEMFEKMKEKVISKFEPKISEQMTKFMS